ncbi:hypothetical protein ACH5RR_025698 [Cinchona calisaya]|uniref:Uncharacterized protein n=1 Tax=Cinchona calisaya TaxID=153742 RepID=A0ABD2Z2B7_9GENT
MSSKILLNFPISSSSSPPPLYRPGRSELLPLASSSFSSFAKPPRLHSRRGFRVGTFLFDPNRDPILKDALKEPIAFMGGMFAGLLRLDLNEDPLREWIARTAEAAGVTDEEIGNDDVQSEESPQQIEIE